ncbi:metallophosphoesterase [Brevundimonas sp. A19_0]|uniref:metallophosphoesterase n=1 Tax=Brevundimonas sp. A19_0 TaxID=2821087 RepID=UPI001ADBF563|nr:metallophosphoesterase [Brevundimonas sp. A19_0]
MAKRPINVVHISDMHFTAVKADDQSVVLGAFINDIQTLKNSSELTDLLFFSGDVVKDADEQESYYNAADVISGAARALAIDESNIVICPGNHDAARSVLGPVIDKIVGWQKAAMSRKGANELFASAEFRKYVSKAFENYTDFVTLFSSNYLTKATPLFQSYYFRELSLGVVALNTACLTTAGLAHKDRGFLCISEHALEEALDAIPVGIRAVVIGHHPLDWLNEENERAVEQILASRAAAYFHGHVHDPRPREIRTIEGNCFFAQSGALYTDREYYNGYSLLSFIEQDGFHTKARYRSYFERRKSFDKAIDVLASAEFFSSDKAREVWKLATPSVDFRLLGHWRQELARPYFEAECCSTLSAKSLDDVFIPPDFERATPIKKESETRVGAKVEVLSASQVIAGTDNLILSSDPESGKTSLLRQWAVSMARSEGPLEAAGIPVLLSHPEIPQYAAKDDALIRSKLPDLPDGVSIKALRENGLLTFLVDDVDLSKSGRKQALSDFIERHARCRFVIASATPLMGGSTVAPIVAEAVPFTHLTMKPYRASQMRSLVDKFGARPPAEVDEMLQRMLREAKNLNMPLTPVTGTFLIQIYESDGTAPYNRANLVQRFIEILLDKFAPRDLIPGAFDFVNRSAVLADLAEFMTRAESYEIAEAQVLTRFNEYMSRYGFSYNTTHLLDYYVEARILERVGSNVQFKLRAFLEYFIALRMTKSIEFKDYIFEEERFLGFISEVSFYCALERDDEALFDMARERFRSELADMWTGVPDLPNAKPALEDINIPDPKSSLEELYGIEQQILHTSLTQADRDLVLDAEHSYSMFPVDQKVKRVFFREDGVKSIGMLCMLSAILKHNELIEDKKKREALAEALDGWLEFCILSLVLVPTISKEKRFYFNGVEYAINFPEDWTLGEIAQRLTLTMPIAVAKLASFYMGTEKLSEQLAEGLGSETEPRGRQLMKFNILADQGTKGIASLAQEVGKAVQGSRYLSNVLVRKLHELVGRYALSEPELERLREVTADTVVRIEGATGRKAGERKGKLMAAYRSREMFFKLTHRDDNK